MLHVVGNESNASRITLDAVGPFAGAGAYSVITSRIARGSYTSPTATQVGDTFLRISGVGYGTTGYPVSGTTIELAASQTFTDSNAGTQINFYTTPLGNTGSTAKTLSAFITPKGLTLPNISTRGTGTGSYNGNGGITFADDSYQNTAFNNTSAVTSVTVGVGLSQTTTVGDVGIDATGVQSITGTANRIIVTDLGGQNFNISAPQDLNTSSTLTFANLTITGNLTVNGTTTTANSANLDSKVLYLAANSTSNSQIDQGGIILGNANAAYAVSILYDLNNNQWTTGTTGLTTGNFIANTANVDFLNVQNGGHFGLINEQLDYPNAYVQVDSNVNSYSQIVSQNHSPGTSASTDLVLVNDIGNDGNHYIDMGINGSNYTDPAFSSTLANDGYLFVNQGNLVIGTDTPGQVVNFVAGGTTSNDIIVTISNTGITTPGNVQASYFIGNGGYLTGLPAGNIVGQVANALVAGTVYTNAQPNITSVGTLTGLVVSGNITSGNANLGNVATANFFVGNGYGLTNINVANIVGTIANANYAAYAGNVTLAAQSNITSLGTLTGLVVSGNITSGNANLGNLALANYFSGNANALFNIQGANVTGQVSYAATANAVAGSNVSGAVGLATFATTANAVAGANVSGAVAYATTANSVAGANVSGAVAYATTANSVAGANVSGAVAYATTANAVAGANVSGTVANATYAVSSGSVANSLTINNSGTGSASGVTFNGGSAVTISYNTVGAPKADGTGASGTWGISITGNANVANTANAVAGANVSGQVSYAAVANSVAGANVSGAVGLATFATTANAVAGANVSGQVSFAATANAVAGGNVSGAVGLATFATTANAVAGANVSGTVANSTAANTLLANNSSSTSAFLTFVTSSANGWSQQYINAGVSANLANASITATTFVGALSGAATTAGTVTTNAQPNITSVGTLTGFTSNGVVNFTNTSNVTLGAVSNLHISGGTSNYVMKTDGTGNLAWIDVSSLSNNAPYGDQLVFVNNANVTLTGTANTTQSMFGLTNGVTLSSNTRYIYRIVATLAKTGNQDASLNYSLALGVGTVLAQHAYNVQSNENNTRTGISAGVTMMSNNLTAGFTTPVTVSTTSPDTTAFIPIIFEGVIDVTTGGTVNFMITNSKVLTTFTLLALAEITLIPVSTVAANTTVGTWS
jgi:hypothetical protein